MLLVGFFANEWRWVAAAAAARYAFFRGDAAAGVLQYIFTLEEWILSISMNLMERLGTTPPVA